MSHLALVSIYILFLELLIIRWIGTEVRIFAYLQNTVLVTCFLGLGVGCWASKKKIRLINSFLAQLAVVISFAIPQVRNTLGNISELLSSFSDFVIFSPWLTDNLMDAAANVSVGLALSFVLLLVIFEMFFPLGQILGRLFNEATSTLASYSVNIGGSLVGIWLFVLASYFSVPPVLWMLIATLFVLPLIPRFGNNAGLERKILALSVLLSYFAGLNPDALLTRWSPYQKLVLYSKESKPEMKGEYLVNVNNASYQEIINLSKQNVDSRPDEFAPEHRGLGQYDIPFAFHPAPKKILIVGSGTGNDVAGALRHGAEEVVAVDIDPVIIEIGKAYHPERPYSSSKVRIVNDDARSYFATSNEKFDLILFGLLDSHTATSFTNTRLDHYVYTRESISRAKSLLSPGGVIVLSFYSVRWFITDRFATVMTEVFGTSPLVFKIPESGFGRGGVMFVDGDKNNISSQLQNNPGIRNGIEQWQRDFPIQIKGATKVATDDWPYIYLASPSIPYLYYVLAALMGLILVYCNNRYGLGQVISDWDRSSWHFFFMGAAFLLLEVQNISKASVVLGNTWDVNAVIISGVMTMILLSNYLVYQIPKFSVNIAYLGILAACIGLYLFDLASLSFLPYTQKALLVGGLTTLPMLFSGVVFIKSFMNVSKKDQAIGANLLGGIFGGLLQSITFVTGIKALLLIVAGLYLLAFYFGWGKQISVNGPQLSED